jgi:hypothetical protein
MNTRFAGRKLVFSLLAAFAMLLLCVSLAQAQGAGTGAITGTITDPSGGAVANVTVTATNIGTNQSRDAKTGADGVYKFSLLPPGNYRLKFSAAGFKSSEVPSVTVNVTETASVNQVLQVGAVTESVTVEANVETLQTESSTLGQTVTGSQITALPMANGNYTEILSLSAGTTVGVDNATSIGKGTQDISANGVDPGSNNFQMDGVAVNNIANSGSANDGTIYGGIPIPSPDAISEFKVQTSTYDASYGRNPGANVNVVTKSGTNNFHGSAFEFLRNSQLNSSDYFYNLIPNQPHEVLNQNQFGGTIGGPIKKDKLFFFFSYRGTRSKNAVAPQGQTFGALLPTTLDPYAAIGSRGMCNPPPSPLPASGDTTPISLTNCNAAAVNFANALGITNIVGLRIFQLQTGANAGVPNNYYIPAPISDPHFCSPVTTGPAAGIDYGCNFSVPAIYNENQYVANADYVINSKHTLSTKYFFTQNPQTLYLGQTGGNLPGTPVKTPWGNQDAVLKLTSLLSNNFVNEARVSYQRTDASATVTMPVGGCPTAGVICGSPQQLGMQPLVPGFNEGPSMVDVVDNYGMFGGLLPFTGPTNQLQAADQISWSHGRHSIRAGYEYEWTNWPLTDAGLQQGLLLLLGDAGLAGGGDGGNPFWNVGCLFCVKGITGEHGITHFYQLNNENLYVLDDWKVSSRLTINVGLRWEYDGLLSDKYGRLSQVWLNRMAPNADIPDAFSATNPIGIQQYVVPSNFAAHFGPPPTGVLTANNRNSVEGHAPYSDFAPRFGFAWQPLSGGKLVVRGGAGIFYDREGLDRLVHAFEQGYPYAATYDYGFESPRWTQATLARPYPVIGLVCMPSDLSCNTDFGLGFATRFFNPATANLAFSNCLPGGYLPNCGFQENSGLNTPLDPTRVHTPLVQEYSLGIQYQFVPGWVLEVGYVGSTGINLTDYNHNHNQATLVTPTPSAIDPAGDIYGICQVIAGNTICNTANNASFRVPYLGYEATGLQSSDNNARSFYNSLQVTVRHQFSHGLTLQAAYTWSRDLTTVFNSNSANINDSADLGAQYGPASYGRDQRFVVNYSYDLPFGKGTQGMENKLIGGWNVSGVTIAQSGDFLTFINPGNANAGIPATGGAFGTSSTGILTGVSTAQFCSNWTGGNNVKNPGGTKANLNSYWNPKAFFSAPGVPCESPIVPYGDATATEYGNSGVGIVTGPGQFNWDISILKNTQITEKVRMQFRTDFYNAFNHSQFSDPEGFSAGSTTPVSFENVTAPNFATISRTSVNPRLIQFGLRFMF